LNFHIEEGAMGKRARVRVRCDELLPTAERLAQGGVVRLAAAILDVRGELARPYKGLDTLGRMERAGTINPQERRAGDRFHELFRKAMFDRLRAADPTRLPVILANGNSGRFTHGDEGARLAVISALDALGGIHTEPGSCAWHVLGCETPLVTWALSISRGRRISKLMASGILLSDLQILRGYFGV
jgi:hypothetical protein